MLSISQKIESNFPEFLRESHPEFIQFVRHYYEFLEAGEYTVMNGEYFSAGDMITLPDTTQIKVYAVDGNRLFLPADKPIAIGSILTIGSDTTIVKDFRPNPVRSITDLLKYRNIDETVDRFFSSFKNEFMRTIPHKLANGIDERTVIKNITDLYRSKGNLQANELFFRMLLDDSVELYYPSADMIRASGGQWSQHETMTLRLNSSQLNGNTLYGSEGLTAALSNFIGQKISQVVGSDESPINARIEEAIFFEHDSEHYIKIILNSESLTGCFRPYAMCNVQGHDGYYTSFIIMPSFNGVDFDYTGQYNPDGYGISVTGMYNPAEVIIGSTGKGTLDSVIVIDDGDNYQYGSTITVNTNEGHATLNISGINPPIESEDGDDISFEDGTIYQSNKSGHKILIEDGTPDAVGSISDVTISNNKDLFDHVPLISTVNLNGIESAKLEFVTTSIGYLKSITIKDFGFISPIDNIDNIKVNCPVVFKLTDITGQFIEGEGITGGAGKSASLTKFIEYNSVMVFSVEDIDVGGFVNLKGGNEITGITSGAKATILNVETATGTPIISGVARSDGTHISSSSFISEYDKRVQDNFYYQNYAYVIKTSEAIDSWRDFHKNAIHPAGFNVFGEIAMTTRISAKSGVTFISETFTPELFSTFVDIFQSIVHRRGGHPSTGVKNQDPMTLSERYPSLRTIGDYDVTTKTSWHYNLCLHTGRHFQSSWEYIDKYKFVSFGAEGLTTSEVANDLPGHTRLLTPIGGTGSVIHPDNNYVIPTRSGYRIADLKDVKIEEFNHQKANNWIKKTNIALNSEIIILDREPTRLQTFISSRPKLEVLDLYKFMAPPYTAFNGVHNSPSINRVNIIGVGSASNDTITWTHPDFSTKGMNRQGYEIQQFNTTKISDMVDNLDRRHSIGIPSEITQATYP